jgi:hypothetical protein
MYSLYENRGFEIRAMAWAVGCRHFIADYRVRFQVNTCQIYGGQSGKGIGFSSSASVSVSIITFISHTHSFIYTLLLPKRQTGKAWELSKKQGSFREGPLGREVLSLILCFKGLTSACCE